MNEKIVNGPSISDDEIDSSSDDEIDSSSDDDSDSPGSSSDDDSDSPGSSIVVDSDSPGNDESDSSSTSIVVDSDSSLHPVLLSHQTENPFSLHEDVVLSTSSNHKRKIGTNHTKNKTKRHKAVKISAQKKEGSHTKRNKRVVIEISTGPGNPPICISVSV